MIKLRNVQMTDDHLLNVLRRMFPETPVCQEDEKLWNKEVPVTSRQGIHFLVDGLKDPVKIERALREVLPPEKSSDFCHRLVHHGRAVCSARKPECDRCCVRHVCQTYSG